MRRCFYRFSKVLLDIRIFLFYQKFLKLDARFLFFGNLKIVAFFFFFSFCHQIEK